MVTILLKVMSVMLLVDIVSGEKGMVNLHLCLVVKTRGVAQRVVDERCVLRKWPISPHIHPFYFHGAV